MRDGRAAGGWPVAGVGGSVPGWRPTPISEFVLKLAGGCNLACDYCYVYTGADQSWLHRPAIISADTVRQVGHRVSEHALRHGLDAVRIVFHGGEPLMAGWALIEDAVRILRAALEPEVSVAFIMQTNGVRLDRRGLERAKRCGLRIGISLDGGAAHHDVHRRFRDGRGSHPAVAKALALLTTPAYRELFAGLLATIDLRNDPVPVYEALVEFAPPTVDFLLPHGTWSQPPVGRVEGGGTPYGEWLIAVFERWFAAPRRETAVRLFEGIITLLVGGVSESDQVGLSPAAFLVVDTDGTLQQVDSLKVAYPGAPETGMNVFDHAIDAVYTDAGVVRRQSGIAALSTTCRQCRLVRVCGGGHYAHRYREGNGFDNPSVYCADLEALIDHIAGRLAGP